jgi:hypothetical protein
VIYHLDEDTNDDNSDYVPSNPDNDSESDSSDHSGSDNDSGSDDDSDYSDGGFSSSRSDATTNDKGDTPAMLDDEHAGVQGDVDGINTNEDVINDDNPGPDISEPEPEPPDNRRRSAWQKARIAYTDMSTATHLKTVGYTNLIQGLVTAKKIIKVGCVNVAWAINEYHKPGQHIVTHTILSQYSLKKGLRLFGEPGAGAVTKELKQLHDRGVIEPKLPSELTSEQQRRALSYLMFLKEK